MIAILSKDGLENSTCTVIDWLHFFKADFTRINGNDILKGNSSIILSNKDDKFLFDDKNRLKKINVVYYRRWRNAYLNINENNKLNRQINQFLDSEANVLTSYFFYKLQDIYWLGKPGNLNKLKSLNLAIKNGLRIPKTIITTRKKKLYNFFNREIITKVISEVDLFEVKRKNYAPYTEIIDIEELPEYFLPTLFQEKIEKKFEIRSFFIMGEFYSMAIFSQSDEQTKVDFRRYNYKKPNRNIPFKLPDIIEKKLSDMMKCLELNTGSIDLIYTNDEKYIFLEINPNGQFGMVSKPCNYNLHKIIAKKLISIDEKEKLNKRN
jgi:ATP-GRASP peptide maturase of grasp-with-spasm system